MIIQLIKISGQCQGFDIVNIKTSHAIIDVKNRAWLTKYYYLRSLGTTAVGEVICSNISTIIAY